MEVAFRVKDSVAVGQTINIGIQVISGTTAGYVANFTFTVSSSQLMAKQERLRNVHLAAHGGLGMKLFLFN